MKRLLAVFLCVAALCWAPATAIAGTNKPLTYDQVKGTGLANKCPDVSGNARGRAVIPVPPGQSISLIDICLEPTNFFVKEESSNKRKEAEFVPAKLLTRATSSLDFIKATVTAEPDGTLVLREEEGLDYQPITVKMPGGEMVAFLFSMKNFEGRTAPGVNAISTAIDFEGEMEVPTYRGGTFIDPKGRGLGTGYDAAEALPAKRDDAAFYEKSNKKAEYLKGKMYLQVARLDTTTGELAGTFECEQPSDTDLGAEEPREVRVRGIFYARLG
ncbi:MAG: photosystem II manganese-stabilizing polypeptide [Pseudanabaenaceae cyanobacterium]